MSLGNLKPQTCLLNLITKTAYAELREVLKVLTEAGNTNKPKGKVV